MPDRILYRTWSVRTVSPLARPLVLLGAATTVATIASSSAAATAAAGRYADLTSVGEDLTDRVRSSLGVGGGGGGVGIGGIGDGIGGAENGTYGGRYDDGGGTYVTLAWIGLDGGDDSDDGGDGGGDDDNVNDDTAEANAAPKGRKRPRSSVAIGQRRRRQQRHLHVDVRVRDQPAAQILLCFARSNGGGEGSESAGVDPFMTAAASTTTAPATTTTGTTIRSFDFLLLRGSARAYQPVLLWIESTLGCRVGSHPFRPSPADVAGSLAGWMRWSRRLHKREMRRMEMAQGGRTMGEEEAAAAAAAAVPFGMTNGGIGSDKPLEVTFAVPAHLRHAGLERITLTVPPVSLSRLCDAVERGGPDGSGGGTRGGNANKVGGGGRNTPQTVTDSEKDDESMLRPNANRSSSSSSSSGNVNGSSAAPSPVPTSGGAGANLAAAGPAGGSQDADDAMGVGASNDAGAFVDDDNNNKQFNDDDDDNETKQQQPLPILRALQCYVFESFHIDVRSFAMVRAAAGQAAVLGCDGRVKPLDLGALPRLLEDLGGMVRRRRVSAA